MAVRFDPEKVVHFSTPEELAAWFDAHAATADELWVGFWKKHTGRPSVTWAQAVDEALCHGWIDSVRHGVDADRSAVRFTPRRPGSVWSRTNVANVQRLIAEGRMRPAGLAAFEARREDRTGVYSFEQPEPELSPEQLKEFRKHRAAWRFFEAQPPGYRRRSIRWVVSAKKEETRARRLDRLVEASARGERL